MTWIIGIDEAGYGPNLGPFVMTAAACHVPACCALLPNGEDRAEYDLWRLLHPAVRRSHDADQGQLLIDDSKRVYAAHGLAGLECGVLTALAPDAHAPMPTSLATLMNQLCLDTGDELRREVWYRGLQSLPMSLSLVDLQQRRRSFADACAAANVRGWQLRSVVICPQRFNALIEKSGTKGYVLAYALTDLLRWYSAAEGAGLSGEDEGLFVIDKHGGRNTYAAMIQHALPQGILIIEAESQARSAYRVHGLRCNMRLVFQPCADSTHFCVALASMASKYLREMLMLEFNRFWQEQIPGLKATAGYPGDAARFFQAIRPAIEKLGLPPETLWRRK